MNLSGMRKLRAVIPMAIAVALAGVWYVRNPERMEMDDSVRAAARGATVHLPEGATYYEAAGPDTGRVIVLVHGFSVPSYIWDPTFNLLAGEGFRVIRYDLYGRGRSDRPDASYDPALYDAQLDGLIDSLGVRGPVDLVGLSFGGLVVAHYASTHAARVRSLTFVDPLTKAGGVPWFIALPGVGAYIWQTVVVPGMAEGQLSDFLHPEWYPTWPDRYRAQMQYRGFGRALRRTAMARRDVDFAAMYASIAQSGVPVLLIWGRQDKTLPIEDAEVMRQAIPALDFFPVDSSGHLPHIEQSASFNAKLLAFLRR